MLGRLVILIDSSMAVSVFSREVSVHDALVCFELDIEDETAINELCRVVYTSQYQLQFSIKLNISESNDITRTRDLIEKALAITFSINYFRDIPSVPVFFSDQRTLSSTIKNLINDCLIKQGYEQGKFIEIDEGAVVDENIADNVLRNYENRATVDSFTSAVLKEGFVFINAKGQYSGKNTIKLYEKLYQQIKERYSTTGLLLEENYRWQEVARNLKNENYFQKLQIARLTQSDAKIHPASAAYYIKSVTNFYKHEYEILPLWYKRIGHIIKVIMGKRNFRSLFNDKIKKYK